MTATLTIDPDSPVPPFEQLRGQLDQQIRSGALPPGAQLPTVRQLAADLDLAKNTVVRAYRALEDAGLVVGDRRRGTVVLERTTTPADRDRFIVDAARRFASDMAGADVHVEEAIAALRAVWPAHG